VTTNPVLELRDVSAGYNRADVVRSMGLSVFPGEVVALLGPNGSGKTTTLRAISRLLPRCRGSVRVLGRDVAHMSPYRVARLGVSHVAEGRSVFFALTVAEHFRLRLRGQRLNATTAYEYFPLLRELRDRRAGLLSGGEQQMLALAFALAREPRLLLVDELSLGLAPIVVERLLPVIRRYATQTGAGVLLVEQHIELALEVADRALVLTHGEIALERHAAELRHDADLLLSSYLG
jgi:branched-chain amino acid transport system ATP-binding protein